MGKHRLGELILIYYSRGKSLHMDIVITTIEPPQEYFGTNTICYSGYEGSISLVSNYPTL